MARPDNYWLLEYEPIDLTFTQYMMTEPYYTGHSFYITHHDHIKRSQF